MTGERLIECLFQLEMGSWREELCFLHALWSDAK